MAAGWRREYFGRFSANNGSIDISDLGWDDILAGKTGGVIGSVSSDAVRLLSPAPTPGKIVCVGLNYRDHIRETGMDEPERPLLFTKFTSSLNHPGGLIEWSAELTQEVDFEAELAAVIGRRARHVTAAEALDYVAGYTCANDVSARDWQIQRGGSQFCRGKSFDTFAPLGPCVATTDEIADPNALGIRTILNGEVMQESCVSPDVALPTRVLLDDEGMRMEFVLVEYRPQG